MTEPKQETAVAEKKPAPRVDQLMEGMAAELERALPRHLRVDQFLRVALTTVRRTPQLMKAHPKSLLSAMMDAAQLGLPIDGILGHGHLVPFWSNKLNGYEVTLIPGYKGLMALAKNTGLIHHFESAIVYEGDVFAFERGLEPKLRHVPTEVQNRGEWIGAYCVAVYKEGPPQFEYMPRADIDIIKDRVLARAKNRPSPWRTDELAMAQKTVCRRLCKWMQLSPELDKAVAADEAFEQGRFADLSVEPVHVAHDASDLAGTRAPSNAPRDVEVESAGDDEPEAVADQEPNEDAEVECDVCSEVGHRGANCPHVAPPEVDQ